MKVVLRSLENPKTFCQMEIKAVPEQLYDYQDLLFDWYEEENNDTNLRSIVMLRLATPTSLLDSTGKTIWRHSYGKCET